MIFFQFVTSYCKLDNNFFLIDMCLWTLFMTDLLVPSSYSGTLPHQDSHEKEKNASLKVISRLTKISFKNMKTNDHKRSYSAIGDLNIYKTKKYYLELSFMPCCFVYWWWGSKPSQFEAQKEY